MTDAISAAAGGTAQTGMASALPESLRMMIEAAPNPMVMIGADGVIVLVNSQAERAFGYARTELLGEAVEILVPEEFRRNHPEHRAGFFATPHPRPMGLGRDLFGRRKDGSTFPVEIGLSPIQTDSGIFVLSSIVDLTQWKRQQERFRLVVEAAPNAMVMVNPQGQIEMVNTQAENVFGYSRGEMIGQPIEILVPPRFHAQHPGYRAAYFTNSNPRPMGAGRDLYGRRKDGSEFPVEIGLNPIETEDGMMVLSAIVDISDRKQKEERIAASLKEKEVLLGEIHHRVKNNLQFIRSLIDLQAAKIEDESVRAMLIDCKNRINSMALVHNLLYQSKDFTLIDFQHFIQQVIHTLKASFMSSDRRVDLQVDADRLSLPIDTAIPCGLIVNELIANAFKHAFPDDRRGRISVLAGQGDDKGIVISVSDDGIGIPEGKDIADGETLGLTLVHLLTDQIGGALHINRANPTRFELRFSL